LPPLMSKDMSCFVFIIYTLTPYYGLFSEPLITPLQTSFANRLAKSVNLIFEIGRYNSSF
ncbi:MAG: hypothetical protein KA807_10625, partial [Prolixibacteraceae bacterium]|nr:hypothetical protein [Prolixibacteraceae bacterium]